MLLRTLKTDIFRVFSRLFSFRYLYHCFKNNFDTFMLLFGSHPLPQTTTSKKRRMVGGVEKLHEGNNITNILL